MKKYIIGAMAMFIAGGIFATAIIKVSDKANITFTSQITTTVEAASTDTTVIEEKTELTTEATALISLNANQTSQWQAGNNYCYGYSFPINNTLNKEIKDWKAVIEFSDNVEIMQLWNGSYTVNGKTLTVTPVDYNKTISPGAAIDFGFNCQTPSQAKLVSATLYENNEKIGADTVKPQTVEITGIEKKNGKTPFEKYGKLSVKGVNIVGADGNPVTLQGVSTHGIGWFPQYVNSEAFKTLRDTMNVDIIRLALYSSAGEAYTPNLHAKVKEGVKYASDLGMYAIIDWHILANGNPNTDKATAISFFTEMAKTYADSDNVIYEICNEPNGDVQWERDIKPYAQELISVIRQYDKDAIIIVGTPTWSQDVDVVAKSPIANQQNIMYALHFYAATHTDSIRNKLTTALDLGLPVIVSEFSICDASGNGAINEAEAQKWIKLLRDKKVSYVTWSLCNKNETSALINSNCTKTSGWSEDELSAAGKWIKNVYNN